MTSNKKNEKTKAATDIKSGDKWSREGGRTVSVGKVGPNVVFYGPALRPDRYATTPALFVRKRTLIERDGKPVKVKAAGKGAK